MQMRSTPRPPPPAAALRQRLALDAADDRERRLEERRRFVELKQCFIEAVAALPGALGDSLRHDVRRSALPVDLWRLRRTVLATLSPVDPRQLAVRVELQTRLDRMFPNSGDGSGFVGF